MNVNIKNISCGYGKKTVISHLNLSFNTGESICILGANGIGKTTFFKSLLGQIELLCGDIEVDGISLKCIGNKERSKVFAYVPQAKNYFYRFLVRDIILMGRASHIKELASPSEEDYEIVDEVIKMLSLEKYEYRYYDELSGGEQQIVLLARAIAQKSNYILLDEPASNLDYFNQRKMINVINALREKGIGVLMVSHNPEHAFMCCEKALLIYKDGSYIFDDTDKCVTSNNLTKLYEIPVGVAEFKDEDNCIQHVSYLK